MSNGRKRSQRHSPKTTTATNFTRRQVTGLAVAAAVAGILPRSTPVAAETMATVASKDELSFAFSYVGERLGPAWARWHETSAQFADNLDLARDLAASRDMDAIMAFRIRPEFVAFDMASRCIRRLGDMTTWSEPSNDAEKAIQAKALGHSKAAHETEAFAVMRRLSARLQQLQGEGLRARDHRYLRDRQHNLQHEYSTAFEGRFSDPLPVGPVCPLPCNVL